ncbi:hypothetical protein AAFF_G00204120 [Aldrovandia affinis]|uniref:SMB domain-containing protein n=1 Tax=Aldrovandia affinis TaxID=143900 RepID=A0AAD7RI31_9TELE|nr:hypothetical protein AAFF_G00204120 [Aldrovandia affinis]
MVTLSLIGSLLALAYALLTSCLAQEPCSDRCGESYYRGHICHCDYECLIHQECCKDYEFVCTTSDSCKGRCGESFKRGRQCSCDSECTRYNQCCPDYQRHCGKETTTRATSTTVRATALKSTKCKKSKKNKPSEPQASQVVKEQDVTLEHTQRPPGSENEDINEDWSDSHLLPLSTHPPPPPILPDEEIQGDEGVGPTPHQVPAPVVEGSSPVATLAPESTSGQEPLPISTSGDIVPLDGADTPLTSIGTPTPWTDQGAIKEEIFSPFPEDPLLTPQESIGIPHVTESTDFSTAVPTIEPPVEITEPNATRFPQDQEPQTTHTTPQASMAATTGSAASASQSSGKPTAPAVTSFPSPAMEAGGAKGDGASVSPSGTQDPSGMSITPPVGTAAQTGPVVPGSTTGADTPLAGGDITNAAQTRGPASRPITDQLATPTQINEMQPAPSSHPTTAPIRPLSVQPSKNPSRPSTLTDVTPALATDNPDDYLPEDNNDTNLCSGRPISGLTTLNNGTVVVFRGHYFWVLDANRSPGAARGITDMWGIPSPIDTVFTRCNCHGKTYFFKGNNYWRFQNDVIDQGYPKDISVGFDKLAGKITAALSLPAFRRRREAVYFFKRGGLVQKYSYKPTTCNKRVPNRVYVVRTRLARQAAPAEISLGKEIYIKLKWKGFPSLVTSAVSIPDRRKLDGYDYYIFSRSKYYNIKIDDDQPALASPLPAPSQQNSAKNWFRCP